MPARSTFLLAVILSAPFVVLVAAPAATAPAPSIDPTTAAWLFGWWTGLGLVFLGAALIAAEAALPTFGLLGFGGLVVLATGLLILTDGRALSAGLSETTAIGVAIVLLAYLVVSGIVVRRAWRHRVATGDPALIGSEGRVVTWSGRAGTIRIAGEIWQARSDAPLPPGADRPGEDAPGSDPPGRAVRVVGRHGLVLRVEPAPAPAPAHDPATPDPPARPKDRP